MGYDGNGPSGVAHLTGGAAPVIDHTTKVFREGALVYEPSRTARRSKRTVKRSGTAALVRAYSQSPAICVPQKQREQTSAALDEALLPRRSKTLGSTIRQSPWHNGGLVGGNPPATAVSRASSAVPAQRDLQGNVSLVNRAGGTQELQGVMQEVERQLGTVKLEVRENSAAGGHDLRVKAPTRADVWAARKLFEKLLAVPGGKQKLFEEMHETKRVHTSRHSRLRPASAASSLLGSTQHTLGQTQGSLGHTRQSLVNEGGAWQQTQQIELPLEPELIRPKKLGDTHDAFATPIPGYQGYRPNNAKPHRAMKKKGAVKMRSQAQKDWVPQPKLADNGNVLGFGSPVRTEHTEYRKDCHIMLGVGSPHIKLAGSESLWPLKTFVEKGWVGQNGKSNEFGF